MKKFFSNTIVLLLLAVVVGIVVGFLIPESGMEGVLVVKQVCGQIIFFMVPLIIIGFVAPSSASLRGNVSRLILLAFALAYFSSVGAAVFAAFARFHLFHRLQVSAHVGHCDRF